MPGSFPFTKKCDGYEQMVELLEEGTIAPDMAPCDAYQTDPIFLQYSEVAFKSHLKNGKMPMAWVMDWQNECKHQPFAIISCILFNVYF